MSGASGLVEGDAVVRMKFNDCLLPIASPSGVHFVATRLTDAGLSPDIDDAYTPHLLYSIPNVLLVSKRVHFERVTILALGQPGALLGDQRSPDHLLRLDCDTNLVVAHILTNFRTDDQGYD